MIYLDTSALFKFIRPEAETVALRAWRFALAASIELVTSRLAQVEVSRTLHRAGLPITQVAPTAALVLQGVFLVEMTTSVLTRARSVPVRRLGTLDAIHLASAEALAPDLESLVTYDRELAAAASSLGIDVLAPA